LIIPILLLGPHPHQIPSLYNNATLIFSYEVLAMIYLNQITTWDDVHIANLNPGVALPSSEIIVVYNQSRYDPLWIAALRQVDANFNQQVYQPCGPFSTPQ
jgi:hypothetical protein